MIHEDESSFPKLDESPLPELDTDFDIDAWEAAMVAHCIGPSAPTPPPVATETPLTGLSHKISIRITTHTLSRLKAQAKARGMPYQTLINQILAAAI